MADRYKYKTIMRSGVEYQVPVWSEPNTSREWFWVRWQQLGLPLPKYVPEVTVIEIDGTDGHIAFDGMKVHIERVTT